MFSKPLFKQSCKANGLMWGIITFAVCFMLTCVMLIGGNGNVSKTKEAIQNNIIVGELQSSIERSALNYYELSCKGLEHFDTKYAEELTTLLASSEYQDKIVNEGASVAMEYAVSTAYSNAVLDLQSYTQNLALTIATTNEEAQEIQGVIMYVFNPKVDTTNCSFDSFYTSLGENAPRYDFVGISSQTNLERKEYRQKYAFENSTIFLSGNMTKEENIQKILTALSSYGITMENYKEFGFNNYEKVKSIADAVLVNYRANLEYRLENIKTGETEESIKAELKNEFSSTLLSTLPLEVTDALKDIGSMDLYGILVGSIFFKIAGLLLPIIYMIMVSNNLIANQVDSGSMAYILSTPTKRKTVVTTQLVFLVGSIFMMFVFTTITSIVCFNIINVSTDLTIGKLLLINLGAFLVMFAMSGISFLTSCWFNRSKHSMAIGGGLNIFFLVATILGLFGSHVVPSIIRMETLNLFNYVSIISLFDVVSILEGGLHFIWKLAILVVIGIVCYIVAYKKFDKKDLPL